MIIYWIIGKYKIISTRKMTSTMLALFSEIERDLISQRTKEALSEKKSRVLNLEDKKVLLIVS